MPPGRAGRLWLQRRLAVARRAATLLDQKLRILRHEQERLDLLVRRTGPAWERTCGEAETWLLRSVLIGGQRAVRHATGESLAEVSVNWTSAMGLRYAAEAVYLAPAADAGAGTVGSAAPVRARTAYAEALDAAVRHAAAQAALRSVEAEMAGTRRRLRAVEDRWIPRLEAALAKVRLELSEAERTEKVRLRWVSHQRTGGRDTP
jgi:V/A-type H+-transporting ATPase subunit D